MKNRLSKSIQRLKKEKKISDKEKSDSKALTAYNVKIFRNLSEKYDLSLTLNNEKFNKENEIVFTVEDKDYQLGEMVHQAHNDNGIEFIFKLEEFEDDEPTVH